MSKQKCKQISIKTHMERFATEELCREYLAKVRWPEGFVCPKCGGRRYSKLSNGLYQCSDCRRQTSVTAGTFMHRSHVPLTKWFLALYKDAEVAAYDHQQCKGLYSGNLSWATSEIPTVLSG